MKCGEARRRVRWRRQASASCRAAHRPRASSFAGRVFRPSCGRCESAPIDDELPGETDQPFLARGFVGLALRGVQRRAASFARASAGPAGARQRPASRVIARRVGWVRTIALLALSAIVAALAARAWPRSWSQSRQFRRKHAGFAAADLTMPRSSAEVHHGET